MKAKAIASSTRNLPLSTLEASQSLLHYTILTPSLARLDSQVSAFYSLINSVGSSADCISVGTPSAAGMEEQVIPPASTTGNHAAIVAKQKAA